MAAGNVQAAAAATAAVNPMMRPHLMTPQQMLQQQILLQHMMQQSRGQPFFGTANAVMMGGPQGIYVLPFQLQQHVSPPTGTPPAAAAAVAAAAATGTGVATKPTASHPNAQQSSQEQWDNRGSLLSPSQRLIPSSQAPLLNNLHATGTSGRTSSSVQEGSSILMSRHLSSGNGVESSLFLSAEATQTVATQHNTVHGPKSAGKPGQKRQRTGEQCNNAIAREKLIPDSEVEAAATTLAPRRGSSGEGNSYATKLADSNAAGRDANHSPESSTERGGQLQNDRYYSTLKSGESEGISGDGFGRSKDKRENQHESPGGPPKDVAPERPGKGVALGSAVGADAGVGSVIGAPVAKGKDEPGGRPNPDDSGEDSNSGDGGGSGSGGNGSGNEEIPKPRGRDPVPSS